MLPFRVERSLPEDRRAGGRAHGGHGPDDATLALRYTASRLVLREARVLYPGSAEEWASDMEALNRGVLMSSAIQDASFTLLGEESA